MSGDDLGPDVTAERLREVVLELSVAREHERLLREEATALFEGLRALTEAKAPEEVFPRLLEGLRVPLQFDAAFVLTPAGEGDALVVTVTTEPLFAGARFTPQRALRRALEGRVVTLVDASVVPEWREQPSAIREAVGSALCMPLQGDVRRALVIFTRTDRRAFQARHEQLARRFQPLATQALRDAERTSALEESNRRLAESLERLRQTQGDLLAASRRAGMADVATTILHNVGNVLNSVNISAGVAMEIIEKSRLGGLRKVVEMLEAHEEDLPGFLLKNPKGRQIVPYLGALAEALAGEQAAMAEELGTVNANLDHVKWVIRQQQSFAKPSTLVETVNLADVVEESLQINLLSRKAKGVRVIRDFAEVPPLRIDRHKLLQILTNLLSNARHALYDHDAPDKTLSVRVEPRGEGFAAVVIRDNGVGIHPDNLSKIFSFGFTTRKEGHGFGLHASACSAGEMGGTLEVASEGLGAGAVFTLILPLSPSSGDGGSGDGSAATT